jgi:hypothetical protein
MTTRKETNDASHQENRGSRSNRAGRPSRRRPAQGGWTRRGPHLALQRRGHRHRRRPGVSIIGTDRFKGGYGAAKVAHEQASLSGPIPARILRAAQFHEFVEELVGWGRQGDVSYVPKMRTQLVAARTVAEALVGLTTGPHSAFATPSAEAPILEIAGPREESLVEMAKLLVARRGDPVRVEGVSDDCDSDVLESGGLLPGPDAKLAGPTFEEWLDASIRVRAQVSLV